MAHRKTKECVGCGDHFFTFKNYDYCADCAVNNNRYLPKSNCSECDGSGMIKFRYQKPRPCKLCSLTKNSMNKNPLPKKFKLTPEEKYWEEVDQLAQEKIYQILTRNIPFQNIPLINEPWRYEETQQKKVGLFLRRDVDYRTLCADLESQTSEGENLPTAQLMAEEITLWYCRLVIKALLSDLSNYTVYENHYFENLTSNEY